MRASGIGLSMLLRLKATTLRKMFFHILSLLCFLFEINIFKIDLFMFFSLNLCPFYEICGDHLKSPPCNRQTLKYPKY